MMINRRRGPYRAWMTDPNGVPPRATDYSLRRRQQRAAVENGEQNVAENPPPDEVPPPPRRQRMIIPEGPWNNLPGNERYPPEIVNTSDSEETSSESENSSSEHEDNDSSGESDLDNEEELNGDAGPQRFPDLDEPLFPGSDCTKFECLLMIVKFSSRHGLSQVAMQDLCLLVNAIMRREALPSSKYMMRQVFGGMGTFNFNFYCKQCENFLVSKKQNELMQGVIECDICATQCNLAKNLNDNQFFVTFPIKRQLKFMMEKTENVLELLQFRRNRNQDPNIISDIYDGKIYSDLCKEDGFLSNPHNISLTINTDGAQVFESCRNTLWPLFFRINEFPPKVRFQFCNCLIGGLWFSNSEPNMYLFLASFVRELINLYEDGFSWTSPDGQRITSRVIVLQCVADSKAKPLVQNCKTHNGYYGCGFCLHPGVMYAGSSQAKYPMNDNLILLQDFSFSYTVNGFHPITKDENIFAVEDRENDAMRQDMELAEINRNAVGEGDINGVKGKSVLMNLPHFDVAFGFPVDYLHCCLLGVTKTVAGFWFDSSNHDNMFYAGLNSDTVNRRLLSIKPPVTISRRPRRICERKKWKGNEWRNWLLFYSLPCMEGIIPSRYLKHHCLLVSAIWILLQERISHDEVEKATRYLGAYCAEFANLYGESCMFFNVHLLLHLGKCVYLHGPLFCFSAFSFEAANGNLVNLVKGTKGVLHQIAHKYSICQIIPKVVTLYAISPATVEFCKELIYYRSSSESHQYDSVTLLGEARHVRLEPDEMQVLREAGHRITSSTFSRMVMGHVMYHARCYKRKGEKSDSSVVLLKNGSFGVIERLLDPINYRLPGNSRVVIVLRDINIMPRESITYHPSGAKAEHIFKCAPVVYGDLRIIYPDSIQQLAILMNCSLRTYVSTFPNRYEKD